jgi:hypothetical protein
MKRVLSALLALSLLGTTAAYAGPPRGHGGHHSGWSHHHGGGDGAAIAVGIGALALFGILAAQGKQDREQAAYERGREDATAQRRQDEAAPDQYRNAPPRDGAYDEDNGPGPGYAPGDAPNNGPNNGPWDDGQE